MVVDMHTTGSYTHFLESKHMCGLESTSTETSTLKKANLHKTKMEH